MRRKHARRLFVTGGAGFLGRHVVNGPASEPWEVIAPSSKSLDLRDVGSVRTMIRDWKPTAIIHTAYRRGDRTTIVDATHNVTEAAERYGCRFVHVSTDALFRGRAAAYTESDEPTPMHDYGRDKADAEAIVADIDPGAAIVRTSLLFGRNELSVHEMAIRDAITGQSRMSFFTDDVRCPALVDDLAAALVQLAERTQIRGILHLGGPDALSRATLATMTARRQGWDESKLRFSTIAEAGLSRPAHVVLDSSLAGSYGLAVRGPTSWS